MVPSISDLLLTSTETARRFFNIIDAEPSIRVVRELLIGIGLSQFNTGIEDHVSEMFSTAKQAAYDTAIAAGMSCMPRAQLGLTQVRV